MLSLKKQQQQRLRYRVKRQSQPLDSSSQYEDNPKLNKATYFNELGSR